MGLTFQYAVNVRAEVGRAATAAWGQVGGAAKQGLSPDSAKTVIDRLVEAVIKANPDLLCYPTGDRGQLWVSLIDVRKLPLLSGVDLESILPLKTQITLYRNLQHLFELMISQPGFAQWLGAATVVS